jgi:hypothetical protein
MASLRLVDGRGAVSAWFLHGLSGLTELVHRAEVPGRGRGDAGGCAPVRPGRERRRALRAEVSCGKLVVNQNTRLPREASRITGIRRGRPTRATGIAIMADQRAIVIIESIRGSAGGR